jgi:predicted MarR family transcription regulator
VISPEGVAAKPLAESAENSLITLIHSLRTREAESPVEPESDELVRQIQLALKNKSQLEIVAQGKSGDEVTFTLEPIGLANNRLRAKDRRADIERTLPLDKILRVRITS